MEPPLGCYKSGCMTFLYASDNGKSWRTVFSGHIHSLWYDENSKDTSPANLIATSNPLNKKPGVWMWNNNGYFLINKNE